VGDQQHGHFLRLLQLLEQVKNLRLNRDIECRGGLIGNHHVRIRRQRNGDHDPLLLPTRHLERVVVDAPLWLRDAHPLQPVHRLGQCGITLDPGMPLDHFGDLLAHRHHRVEAGRGLLKDDADAPTTVVAHT